MRKHPLASLLDGLVDGTDCLEWKGAKNDKGYGQISIDGSVVYVHRYVLSQVDETFSLDDNREACHHCDNPSCIRPRHLFAGTRQDNMDDKMNKGRHGYKSHPGESHGMSKLTEDDVRWARHQYALGMTMGVIGASLNVGYTTIQKIVRGQTWTHVK